MPERQRGRPWLRTRAQVLRNSDTCSICGKPINLELRFPHPYSASVDHVIPVVAGGTNAPHNLRPTHLRCNQSRGKGLKPPKHKTSRQW